MQIQSESATVNVSEADDFYYHNNLWWPELLGSICSMYHSQILGVPAG